MHGLQERVYSLEYTPRTVRATQEVLDKLYEGSALGLKGDSLAYHAGLTKSEYNQLSQFDERLEYAVIAGKADAERELAGVLRNAALAGDAKTALEILKHKHGWQSTSTVKQEISGANGGPIALAAVDFRGLSNEELQQMKQMLQKASGGDV